jgi:hypothetical protein
MTTTDGVPELFAGEIEGFDEPHWEPLERLAEGDPDVLGCFMWMHRVRLSDGRLVHAYKHWYTRRYLHLAEDGTAFTCRIDRELRLRTAPLEPVLRAVLAQLHDLEQVSREEREAADRLVGRHGDHPRAVRAQP